MLNAIVRFSIRYRGIVVALGCAFLAYGVFSVYRVPYSDFPDFAPPEVVIQTEAPGLSSEQVEILVTQPIENSINGVSGIESLRSKSIQGLSVITVVFRFGTDIYRDRQAVSERLSTVAGELPGGVEPPLMTPLTTTTSWVMHVGLTSDKQSLMALRTLADWTVKPRLLAVRGVAEVEVNGGERRQLQVQFDPQKLVQFGLSVEDVLAAARQATGVRGGGFVETANQRIVLQTEGQSLTAAQLAQTVVLHHEGGNVTLGDVARVADAPAPAIGEASIRGTPGVIMVVDSAYGANALEVTRGLDAALADLRPGLEAQGITVHADVFRSADTINIALQNVRQSLFVGSILVMVVLFLFLFNLRTAAISCIAIPLSLLAAVIALDMMGLSLNMMTLGGLSIAIGEVVDDAVIDVENIYRRLRENRALPHPRPAAKVALRASVEVRSAVVYATFAVLLVFVPVLEHVRPRRTSLLPARPGLHLGHCGFAHRGAHRHSRPLHSSAGQRRSRPAGAARGALAQARIPESSDRHRQGAASPHGLGRAAGGLGRGEPVFSDPIVSTRAARGRRDRAHDGPARNFPAGIHAHRRPHHPGPAEDSVGKNRGPARRTRRARNRHPRHPRERDRRQHAGPRR